MLFAPAQIGHVGGNQRVFLSQKLCGLDHAGRSHGALTGLVVALLGGEGGVQVGLQRLVVRRNQVGRKLFRIDQ